MTRVSKYAQKVKRWYDEGTWKDWMVRNAVTKGKITALECAAILGGAQGVLEELGNNPTKTRLLEACAVLGIEADESMTKAELLALIEAA